MLNPDPRLRLVVLGSGVLLALAGFAVALMLPVATGYKAVVASAWLGASGYEWFRSWRAYSRGGTLRLDSAGNIERRGPDGDWQTAKLCAGSVATPRLAWLRVSAPGVPRYAELLCGESHESEEWRRFQVIWRHIGAT